MPIEIGWMVMAEGTEGFFALSEDEKTSFAEYEKDALANEPAEAEETEADEPQSQEAEAQVDDDLDEDDVEQDNRRDRKVPIHRVTKEVAKRREVEKMLQEREREHAVLKERLDLVMRAWSAKQGQQDPAQAQAPEDDLGPMPDPDQDIFAFAKWQAKNSERLMAQLQQYGQYTEQQAARAREEQVVATVAQRVTREEQAFAQEKPDYPQAVEFLKQRQMELYLFRGMDEAQAEQMVMRDARAFVMEASRNNRSIPQALYEMAGKFGFQGQQAAPPQVSRDESGRFRSERVETASRAQAANRSLSGQSGTAASASMTADDVAKMSPAEFQRWLEKDAKSGYKMSQKLFG